MAFLNQVCVVTGAGSGIGRELSIQLALTGAKLVLLDQNAEALESLRKVVPQARTHAVDITQTTELSHVFTLIFAEFNQIDYLFNVAGIGLTGEIRDLSLEDFNSVIDVNLKGTVTAVYLALPRLIQRRSGHIVNFASGLALAAAPLNAPYVASKFAIHGFSQVLEMEMRAFGIQVTVIYPGLVHTQMIKSMRTLKADPKTYQKLNPVVPMPVSQAVKIILSGVAQRKRQILFPQYVRALYWLAVLIPPLFRAIGAYQLKQYRRIRREESGVS